MFCGKLYVGVRISYTYELYIKCITPAQIFWQTLPIFCKNSEIGLKIGEIWVNSSSLKPNPGPTVDIFRISIRNFRFFF